MKIIENLTILNSIDRQINKVSPLKEFFSFALNINFIINKKTGKLLI